MKSIAVWKERERERYGSGREGRGGKTTTIKERESARGLLKGKEKAENGGTTSTTTKKTTKKSLQYYQIKSGASSGATNSISSSGATNSILAK